MVSKVLTGHSFYGSVSYICRDQSRAQILAADGVRAYDYRLAIQDFKEQQALLPSKTKACFHAILSFYPGENPGDETLIAIADRYLKEIGMVHTQFVVTKHTDTAHLHLHIIANLVNNKGKAIPENWIGLRAKKVAQALTQEYSLIPAHSKHLDLTHADALGASEACHYQIFTAIQQQLPRCRNLEELEQVLSAKGIEIQYKYKGGTKERQGISFKMGPYCFKGSEIDQAYSLGNLEKTFRLQAQMRPGLHQKGVAADESILNRSPFTWKGPGRNLFPHAGVGRHRNSKELQFLLKNMLGPQPTEEPVPYDLTIKGASQKRKKKSRRPGQ